MVSEGERDRDRDREGDFDCERVREDSKIGETGAEGEDAWEIEVSLCAGIVEDEEE